MNLFGFNFYEAIIKSREKLKLWISAILWLLFQTVNKHIICIDQMIHWSKSECDNKNVLNTKG